MIINGGKSIGNQGFWRLLTKPNKIKIDRQTNDAWWSKKDNFIEKYLSSYKEILMKIHSIYQNNDPATKFSKSSTGKKWKYLVSSIWKEIKPPKSGSGFLNYHENPTEYKYIDNLTQLQERLYYLYAQEKAGNDNFHNKKMLVIKVIIDQLKKMLQS